MPLSLTLEGAAKSQLVVSLAALLLSDTKAEITADNLNAGKYLYSLSNGIHVISQLFFSSKFSYFCNWK